MASKLTGTYLPFLHSLLLPFLSPDRRASRFDFSMSSSAISSSFGHGWVGSKRATRMLGRAIFMLEGERDDSRYEVCMHFCWDANELRGRGSFERACHGASKPFFLDRLAPRPSPDIGQSSKKQNLFLLSLSERRSRKMTFCAENLRNACVSECFGDTEHEIGSSDGFLRERTHKLPNSELAFISNVARAIPR